MSIIEDIFTYEGVDYVDANHSGTLLVTEQAVIDYNLSEFIDEELDSIYEDLLDNGYKHVIVVDNVTTNDDKFSDEFHSNEELEFEVTMSYNGLPVNLLTKEGVTVDSWMNG